MYNDEIRADLAREQVEALLKSRRGDMENE